MSRFLNRVWISSKEISQLGSWRKTSSWSKILSRHLPLATMPRDSSSWFSDRMVYVQSKPRTNRCQTEFDREETRDFVAGSVVRYWLDRIESSSSALEELERTTREFDRSDDSRQETRRLVAVGWRGSSLFLNIPEWWPRMNVSFQSLQYISSIRVSRRKDERNQQHEFDGRRRWYRRAIEWYSSEAWMNSRWKMLSGWVDVFYQRLSRMRMYSVNVWEFTR